MRKRTSISPSRFFDLLTRKNIPTNKHKSGKQINYEVYLIQLMLQRNFKRFFFIILLDRWLLDTLMFKIIKGKIKKRNRSSIIETLQTRACSDTTRCVPSSTTSTCSYVSLPPQGTSQWKQFCCCYDVWHFVCGVFLAHDVVLFLFYFLTNTRQQNARFFFHNKNTNYLLNLKIKPITFFIP